MMNDVRWFLDRELGGQAGLAAEKKLLHSIKESEFLVLPPGRDSSASSFESETLGESCVFTLEWSRDGRFLAGSTSDNDIRLWDMHGGPSVQGTRFPVKTIAAAHKEIVTCIEWMNKMASEEEAFFSASIDKSIKMWRNSEEVCTLTHHQDWIRCLCLSQSDSRLLSGCVSSRIFALDLETDQVISIFENPNDDDFMNTINALFFLPGSEDVFVSGSRDGYIKVHDIRSPASAPSKFVAHAGKLNSIEISESAHYFLSAGRDSRAKIWDMRMIRGNSLLDSENIAPVVEFSGHRCKTYNIGAKFINGESNVITGSEDGRIVLYDGMTGEVEKTLPSKSKVIQIVEPRPNCAEFGAFASSNTENDCILLWRPCAQKSSMPASPSHVILESTLESVHRSAMEDLMDSFGEQILQLFHRRNINLSSPLSWSTLFQSVSSGNGGSDRESTREVLEMAAQSNTLEQEQDVEEEEVKWGARGPCDDLWTVFERNRRGKRYPGDC